MSHTYRFQITQGRQRTTLSIIARSTFEATCTGLGMVRIAAAPVRITCRPEAK